MSSEFYKAVSAVVALSLSVCAICGASEYVKPCPSCHRYLCGECQSVCRGCEADEQLGMIQPVPSNPSEPSEPSEPSNPSDQPEREPGLPLEAIQMMTSTGDLYVWHTLERGTMPFKGMIFPSRDQWKTVETILMTYIQFTTSSHSIQKPIHGWRYLVGRAHHVHSNRATVQTDYMMVWDAVEGWSRHIVTYYDQTPMPHHKNVFYPLPLPLRFD